MYVTGTAATTNSIAGFVHFLRCHFFSPNMALSSSYRSSIMALAPLALAQYTLAQAGYGASSSLKAAGVPGASSYVAPAGFPTSAFSSYYPVPSGQEPQPALYDPILNITYPLNLTSK